MNKPSLNIFFELECLTERSGNLTIQALYKTWFKGADKRNSLSYLQKLVSYNNESFEFLGILASIIGPDSNLALQFRTSSYIGAVPMRSPITGLQMGDFIVRPRYTKTEMHLNYTAVLDLLGNDISPEYLIPLYLKSGRNFRPPLYLEALKFINILESIVKGNWQKFQNIEKYDTRPSGTINWSKYATNSFKVEKSLTYPISKNILNEYHNEYSSIRYVFDLCRAELQNSSVPVEIKLAIKNKLDFISYRLQDHYPRFVSQLKINGHDKPQIKTLKTCANNFLRYNINDCYGWRLDYNVVFERIVQYVFSQVAKKTGAITIPNPKIKNRSSIKTSWDLHHLEPDLIFKKENKLFFIEAKYKSHLYNKDSLSEKLSADFRNDIHQLMSYMSFQNDIDKIGFLCYPSTSYELSESVYTNSINKCRNRIFKLGIPINKSAIEIAIRELINKIGHV